MRNGYSRARRLVERIVRALPEPKNPIEVELARPWIQAQAIRTVLDIGANQGQFATIARRVFPASRILSFEPIDECVAALKRCFANDPRFEAFQCSVGDGDGVATFHQNEYSPSSSMLAMRDSHRAAFPFASHERLTEVPVRTLDGLLRDRQLDEPILLKMDVQGYEARVIAGARETLRRCQLVLTEVSLESLYEAEPLAHEMITLLVDHGFRIAAVADCLRRPTDDRPLQMDMIFGRA